MPFHQDGLNNDKRRREELCSVLPRGRDLRLGKMRPSRLLPLLHQDEGAVRSEVLRRLPGGARQGARSSATLTRGWSLVALARP